MEKKYKILKDYQSPLQLLIKAGEEKTESEWTEIFPNFNGMGFCFQPQWFKEVEEELTYEKMLIETRKRFPLKFQGFLSNKISKIEAFKVYLKVEEYLNYGWKPDWKNTRERKYHISYKKKDDKNNNTNYICKYNYKCEYNYVYFKSIKLIEKCIELAEQFKDEIGFNFLDVLYK